MHRDYIIIMTNKKILLAAYCFALAVAALVNIVIKSLQLTLTFVDLRRE